MSERGYAGPRQNGFTFNELMIAMNIAAVAVMGLSVGVMSVTRGNLTSDNFTVAVNLAQDKLEKLRSSAYASEDIRCPGGGETAVTAAGSPGGRFNICWNIQRSSLGADLKQIEVTVSWRERAERKVTLATLVFNNGDI